MTFLSTFKTAARATVVAASLGSAALVAMPAQAAQPNLSFQFKFGNQYGGPGMQFNYGNNPKYMCLSDGQLYWQLKNAGYKDVQILKNKGYLVIAVARYHFDWYQLLINRCSGKIKAEPVDYNGPGPGPGPKPYPGPKPFPGPGPFPGPHNGFNITLNF